MRFTTTNAGGLGTHLQGYIKTTRGELQTLFGEPMEFGEGSKVTTEWVIKFEDDTVVTIYDWKRYEDGAPEWDEEYVWHIGGSTPLAVDYINTVVGEPTAHFRNLALPWIG